MVFDPLNIPAGTPLTTSKTTSSHHFDRAPFTRPVVITLRDDAVAVSALAEPESWEAMVTVRMRGYDTFVTSCCGPGAPLPAAPAETGFSAEGITCTARRGIAGPRCELSPRHVLMPGRLGLHAARNERGLLERW